MMERKEILEVLNNIQEEIFCDYCEYCRLYGECNNTIEEKTCNIFEKLIKEIENRLDM